MKVYLLGAGASKSYDQSPTDVRMPIANDVFETFHKLEISENMWVRIGDIVNYIRDFYGVKPEEFIKYNNNIEVLHTEIEEKLYSSLKKNDNSFMKYHRIYMQLVFLFSSIINEIQNGPISISHMNIAKSLNIEDYVLTFNWDTLMDRALYTFTDWDVDTGYLVKPRMIYNESWRRTSTSSKSHPKLIKLHGSTNWLTSYITIQKGELELTQELSPDTFYVYIDTDSPYNTYDGRYMSGYEPFSYGYYPVNLPEKGKRVEDGKVLISMIPRDPYTPKGDSGHLGLTSMPLIIPPVKNKAYDMFGSLFKELWESAEEVLSRTDHIIIIGYSFPKTDIQSIDLFKNAFSKRKSIPKITVIDPSPENIVSRLKIDFGIPDHKINIIEDYFSKEFNINEIK